MLCPVLVAHNIAFLGWSYVLVKPHGGKAAYISVFKLYVVTHLKELFGEEFQLFFFNEKPE